MPLRVEPKCHLCSVSFSVSWRKDEQGGSVCDSCSSSHKRWSALRRKSSRNLRSSQHQVETRSGRRRTAFKSMLPKKSPETYPDSVSTTNLFYKGQYYQIGDIVSVLGADDNKYFAQIYGLASDENGEKSVFLQWLVPTRPTDVSDYFDPSGFKIGMEEEFPRKMEALTFVCNCSEEFFKMEEAPFPVKPVKIPLGCVWSFVGPRFKYV